jgi:hypothetical protein
LEERFELGSMGDIGGEGGYGGTGLGSDFVGGSMEVCPGAGRYGDADSFLGQRKRRCFTESFACGEDEGVFVFEAEVHALIVKYALACLDPLGSVPRAGVLLLHDDAAMGGLG